MTTAVLGPLLAPPLLACAVTALRDFDAYEARARPRNLTPSPTVSEIALSNSQRVVQSMERAVLKRKHGGNRFDLAGKELHTMPLPTLTPAEAERLRYATLPRRLNTRVAGR